MLSKEIRTQFTWTKFEIALAVQEPLHLPPYKGATLRGVFGATLKRLCCFHDPATCDARPPACQCPYGFLFAPKTLEADPRLRTGEEISRPFVIEPPLDGKQQYQPGEMVVFNVLLFGKAAAHLPWFLVTFRDLPPIGIPPHRGRTTLHEIWTVEDLSGIKQRIYSASDQLARNTEACMSWGALAATASSYPTDHLTLHFQTNTILRYLGKEARRIEFHILISRLLQRVEALAYLYGELSALDAHWQEEARQLIHAAKTVRIQQDNTVWNAWTRYSSRQQQEVPMDGVMGKITYSGDLSPFLPLLLLGQYVHVGKSCVFGLGRYTVLAGD